MWIFKLKYGFWLIDLSVSHGFKSQSRPPGFEKCVFSPTSFLCRFHTELLIPLRVVQLKDSKCHFHPEPHMLCRFIHGKGARSDWTTKLYGCCSDMDLLRKQPSLAFNPLQPMSVFLMIYQVFIIQHSVYTLLPGERLTAWAAISTWPIGTRRAIVDT